MYWVQMVPLHHLLYFKDIMYLLMIGTKYNEWYNCNVSKYLYIMEIIYYLRLYMFIFRYTSSNVEKQVHISVQVVKY